MLGNAPDARLLRWGYQHVGILEPTQTLKFTLPPTPNLKFVLTPTPTPDTSQWNIGGIWSSGVGHVYFMYILCISCCLCNIFRVGYARISRRKSIFQWNMGFRLANYFSISTFYTWLTLTMSCKGLITHDAPWWLMLYFTTKHLHKQYMVSSGHYRWL